MKRRHVHPAWLCASLALAATSLGPSAARADEGAPVKAAATSKSATRGLIDKGQQLFEDQQYEESIQALSAALMRPDSTPDEKIDVYRLLALDYITLDRGPEAESAVRGLLVLAPDYALPASESPRFRDFFTHAKERWEAEGRPGVSVKAAAESPASIKHATPDDVKEGRELVLSARVTDPSGAVKTVRVFFRKNAREPFREAKGTLQAGRMRARIPGSSIAPPLVEYYLTAEAADGTVLASRGDAQSPLRAAVEEAKRGWVLPVAIGGGILGAAAIVGGLALAGAFKGSSPPPATGPGTAIVSVSVSEAAR